jgi:hypothetical protein
VPLIVIQRQVGHSNLGITSIYPAGIDNAEIIEDRPRPPRANDPRQRIPAALIDTPSRTAARRVMEKPD